MFLLGYIPFPMKVGDKTSVSQKLGSRVLKDGVFWLKKQLASTP